MAELEGIVERITFHNEENGYTVARFKTATEQLTVVRVLPNISAGEVCAWMESGQNIQLMDGNLSWKPLKFYHRLRWKGSRGTWGRV